MRTTIYITHGGAEARSYDSPAESGMNIIIGESVAATAVIQIADYKTSDPNSWLSVSVADFRAYVALREQMAASMHEPTHGTLTIGIPDDSEAY